MFCCDQELQALRHFASLTGIISDAEDSDKNTIEPAMHDIMVTSTYESPQLHALHAYSYSSDLPKCPDAPRKKPRLMIDDQDDQVFGFHSGGDVPYFPFDGFDRITTHDSTLTPRRLEFDKLVSEEIASIPNVIEPEERREIEPKQEREDGPSREDKKPDERTT